MEPFFMTQATKPTKLHDVMIDIETMGTDPYSSIVSIGAVFFCPFTGELGEKFYCSISLDTCTKLGLSMDPNVVQWWIKQSKEATKVFHGYKDTLPNALKKFDDFLLASGVTRKCIKPWGNGASFDITLLECAYKVCGMKQNWDFWNVRDVRTVVALADGICDAHKGNRGGTYHNALDDAIFQAKYVSQMVALLRPDLA
jgi:hypothetical protein